MFSRPPLSPRRSLAGRLTLWYALLFGLCAVLIFAALHLSLARILFSRVDQELLHEFSELADKNAGADLQAMQQAMLQETATDGVDKIFFRLLSREGLVLAETDNSSFGPIPINRQILPLLTPADPIFFADSMLNQEHPVRIAIGLFGQEKILQVVLSQREVHHFLGIFRTIAAVGLVVLIAVGALGGWLITRRALLGVEAVTRAANEITTGHLSKRVQVEKRGDEIERLATTFNTMLDMIEALITGMRELTDNIAHDLRSPITRMRTMAEMSLLQEENNQEKSADLAAATIGECDRLLGMINTMLDISEAESGAGRLQRQKIDLVALVLDCCELFEPLAEQRQITFEPNLPASLFSHGDRQKLQRVVANLLDNALKYTRPGGRLTITAQGEESGVELSFADNGIGITEQELPHIFERFYRCDQSRSQSGAGLGLSLARALCRAHGGDLTANSRAGEGSTFTVTLPRGNLNA